MGKDQGWDGEWKLPKGTMREGIAKYYRDASSWEPQLTEYGARLLGIPFKSSLTRTSSVYLGAQSILALATDLLLRRLIPGFVRDP